MKRIHLCMSVRGAIKNAPKSHLKTMFTENGKPCSATRAKEILLDELAKGHEVIPVGQCDNFDYKTGCRGHIILEEKENVEIC